MFPQNPAGNKLQFFVFTHFDLRFSIQIYHKQFGTVIFEYDNSPLFFSNLGYTREVPIGFCSSYNSIRIYFHSSTSPVY